MSSNSKSPTTTFLARTVESLVPIVLASSAVACLVLLRGSFGWSWDALNHHIYLGMIAESPRWSLDVAAAASQSYQYPYLYWPAYRLSLLSGSGAMIGAAWAGIQTALLAAPLWVIVRRLFPTSQSAEIVFAYRAVAFTLSLASLPVLAALVTTANDVLATVPILWAVAVALSTSNRGKHVVTAVLIGAGIALKYSNVLFLPLVLLAIPNTQSRTEKIWMLLVIPAATLGGFAFTYCPWAVQLWLETGNPFYPHLGSVFG